MLPTKMLVINLPTLSQTRKQVFGFDLRLGLSQFVICKSSAKFPALHKNLAKGAFYAAFCKVPCGDLSAWLTALLEWRANR